MDSYEQEAFLSTLRTAIQTRGDYAGSGLPRKQEALSGPNANTGLKWGFFGYGVAPQIFVAFRARPSRFAGDEMIYLTAFLETVICISQKTRVR